MAQKVKKAARRRDLRDEFSGEPCTEWIGKGVVTNRRMRLLQDFWYDDRDGKRWLAGADRTVDGASIPQALWTIIGSPYTGCYRKASVVHDIACDDATSTQQRKKADKMYFHACRRGGCSVGMAIIQYIGVRIGAWLPNVGMWQVAEAGGRKHLGSRRQTASDQSIVGTYYEILDEVGDPEAAEFDDVVEAVERHLRAKARLLRR